MLESDIYFFRQQASEVRRALSAASQLSENRQITENLRPPSYSSSITSTISTQSFGWFDSQEPLDYEDFISEHATDRDPLKTLLSFPLDDLQIYLLPRPWRTLQPVTPPEPL